MLFRSEAGTGPYAAQRLGGSARLVHGEDDGEDTRIFGDITSRGIQSGVGTIAGLGYGLPMSRLYATYGKLFSNDFAPEPHSDTSEEFSNFFRSMDGVRVCYMFSSCAEILAGTDALLKLRSLDGAGDVEL